MSIDRYNYTSWITEVGETWQTRIRKGYIYIHTHTGTAVAHWLRCCATNRKVAGSIPDGVVIFH